MYRTIRLSSSSSVQHGEPYPSRQSFTLGRSRDMEQLRRQLRKPDPPTSFTLFASAAYFLAKHSIAFSIWAFSFLISSCACFTATCFHTSSVYGSLCCMLLDPFHVRLGEEVRDQAHFWSISPLERSQSKIARYVEAGEKERIKRWMRGDWRRRIRRQYVCM